MMRNLQHAAGAAEPGPYARAVSMLADRLESRYVYPEIGRKHAAMLRANLAAGRYAIDDPKTVARKLTEDLQATSPDGHLKVDLARPARRPLGWSLRELPLPERNRALRRSICRAFQR